MKSFSCCHFRGWSCSYCVPGDKGKEASGEDSKDHNIRNANDGSNRWWQSPPLSRGLKYRDINITIDLGQVSLPPSGVHPRGNIVRDFEKLFMNS